MEGAILRGAGRSAWASGSWKWKAICPGQSKTCATIFSSLVCFSEKFEILMCGKWINWLSFLTNSLRTTTASSTLIRVRWWTQRREKRLVSLWWAGISAHIMTLSNNYGLHMTNKDVWLPNRCQVGIVAARRGTVNSPPLLLPMKNAEQNVLGSICVWTSKCWGG